MTTYILHARRPGTTGAIDTYKQEATSVVRAVTLTRNEYASRNSQSLPDDAIVLVATADHLEHGVN